MPKSLGLGLKIRVGRVRETQFILLGLNMIKLYMY